MQIVKWLGSRVNPLTCGDRAGKDKVIQDLQRFATGRGRANPYPGAHFNLIPLIMCSVDNFL